MQKKALVCGAGGFIGGHLVRKLKSEGYWVRGVDKKWPEFSRTVADSFLLFDLTEKEKCTVALTVPGGFDEVYQLAADMGGMGFIHSAAPEIMLNSALINLYMTSEAAWMRVPKYFFSSSVCVYPDMKIGDPEMSEDQVIPANPDNEYGWEKIYSEILLQTYAARYGFEARIARFQNCYGTLGTWMGGREKAPAALCRKVAEAKSGGEIEVWGDGTAVRSYTYVSDMVKGIRLLMDSDVRTPVNIGDPHYYTVDELAEIVIKVSGKSLRIKHVDGPIGVASRNFSNEKIYSTGWKAEVSLFEGIAKTYPWVEEQVRLNI